MPLTLKTLKTLARRAIFRTGWAVTDLPRHPGLEVYSLLPAARTKRFFEAVKRLAAARSDERLRPYHPKAIPKIIWMYWAQGEAEAPFVVRRCIESWRRLNPGWKVRVLSEDMASSYVDPPETPPDLPWRCRADLLRLMLLKERGGVWTDATTLCHRPLDDWLPLQASSGFLVFGRTLPNRGLDTWFIASEPGGTLIDAWEAAYASYVMRARYGGEVYFMVMYAFEWAVMRDRTASEAWRRCATLPAQPCFVMLSVLQGMTGPAVIRDLVLQGLPLSKLSWKTAMDEDAFDALVASLRPEPTAMGAER